MEKRPFVGVGMIVVKDRSILMVKRKGSHGSGTWSTPGGYLEFGETPEQCAQRETLEETGVQTAPPRLLTVTNDFFPVEEKHFVTLWMISRWQSGEALPQAEYELSEVGWFALNALPSPLFLPFKNLAGMINLEGLREFQIA